MALTVQMAGRPDMLVLAEFPSNPETCRTSLSTSGRKFLVVQPECVEVPEPLEGCRQVRSIRHLSAPDEHGHHPCVAA